MPNAKKVNRSNFGKPAKRRAMRASIALQSFELSIKHERYDVALNLIRREASLDVQKSDGSLPLDYLKTKIKLKLLNEISSETLSDEDAFLIRTVILRSAIKAQQLVRYHDGKLSKNCILRTILRLDFSQFKSIINAGLKLDDNVPGCKHKNTLMHYITLYSLPKLKIVLETIPEISLELRNRYGETLLLTAIKRCGKLTAITDMLLDYGACYSAKDFKGISVISALKRIQRPELAAELKKLAAILKIIKRGGNHFDLHSKLDNALCLQAVGKDGLSLLHILTYSQQETTAMYILPRFNSSVLSRKDSVQNSLLHICAADNLDKLAIALLNKKIDIDPRNSDGYTPWTIAVSYGNTKMARLLFKHGANPNLLDHKKSTLLHSSVKDKHFALTKRAIECGASPNTPDGSGYSAVYLALTSKHYKVLRFFVKNQQPSAKVMLSGLGERDLFNAARIGDVKTIQLLAKYEVNLDCVDHNGRTALYVAIAKKQGQAVTALIDCGANPGHKDKELSTPAKYADYIGQKEIAAYIKRVENKAYNDAYNNLMLVKGCFTSGAILSSKGPTKAGIDLATSIFFYFLRPQIEDWVNEDEFKTVEKFLGANAKFIAKNSYWVGTNLISALMLVFKYKGPYNCPCFICF